MSEFQIGLLVVGIVVLLVVLAFNYWQQKRYLRLSETSFKRQSVDALLEPTIGDDAPLENSSISEGSSRIAANEVAIADQDQAPASSVSIARLNQNRQDSSILSPAIDLIVNVDCASGILLSELILGISENGQFRRINMEALFENNWQPLRDDFRYKQISLGLQLVNRQGPVSVQELQQFEAWIAGLVARFDLAHSQMNIFEAHQNAVALDHFCNEVDILIAVHVVAMTGSFAGTKMRAIAEAAGLNIEADGLFRKRDEDGRVLYRLANEGEAVFQAESMRELATNSVVLEFDVARSPGGVHSFNKFRQFAEHLASGLGGKVVDDNRAPLGSPGFEAISKELSGVYQAMMVRGIAPGSSVSLRLFS